MCGFGAGLHKDTHDLGLQFRKIEHKYGTAGMKNQIRCRREEIQMAAKRLAHASLDAIALVGLAQDLAYGEPEPWRMWSCAGLGSEKPTHGCGLVLARASVSALEISMVAQAKRHQRLLLCGMLRRGLHGKTAGNPAEAYKENQGSGPNANAA